MAYQEVLTALADPTRRGILESLRVESKSVVELAENQTVSRPAVSQHLKVLHDAGLVRVTSNGNRRIYSVKQDGLVELRQYLETFWSDILTAFASEIEQKTGEKNARTNRKNN